ncbi:MAG: hypothetical protein DRR19_15195 [Candidatus Parabeggiatoa sp. nov. 1]|nr:MAG: hypothetical protein DRR19_15195 [Gammaproteobacteria bacterium]HEC84896.1 hypothetical protein [Thioploca sp.]
MSSENQTNQQTVGTDKISKTTEGAAPPNANDFNPLTQDSDAPELSAEVRGRYSPNFRERYVEIEELLEFAAEAGKLNSPNLATEVKQLKKVLFYTSPESLSLDALCKAEAELERLYTELSELLAPVNVNILTLRATSTRYEVQRPWWQAIFLGSGSVGRNFFRKLLWVAILLSALIFLRQYARLVFDIGVKEEGLGKFLTFVDPFLYGALGALVYLYRDLTESYLNRTLHPKKLATNWLRIFMGGILGGLLVHLFGPLLGATGTKAGVDVSAIAIGFLGGYSVDFFYQTLDRIIHTITPKLGTPTQEALPPTPKQAQIELLTKSLKEMSNEEDKTTIRRLLEKL